MKVLQHFLNCPEVITDLWMMGWLMVCLE